jgi:hypothetical protein
VKNLFALFAVAALAAVGCDDKGKSSGRATNQSTGSHLVQTNRATVDTTTHVTNTVHLGTETGTRTHTEVRTVTKPESKPGGPAVPDPNKKNGKD